MMLYTNVHSTIRKHSSNVHGWPCALAIIPILYSTTTT